MEKSNKRFNLTLGTVWLFTILYSASYLMNMKLFPFVSWINALYKPVFTMMFGG
ncbi:hypothetical protein ACFQPF_02720 [Fictibacillus iocasae]|uniref:Uncharacterized protein n=1 Tax=Fictibacillus iocasae TaxID=2715437 RepID=A0ABW2NIT3_9BACL